MKLIPDARSAWRFWSVRFASLLLVWELLPAEHQTALLALAGIPVDLIPGLLAALILASRIVQQPAVHKDDPA